MEITNIILADDHRIILDGLYSLLNEQAHLQVIATANNGLDLIQSIAKNHPNLVICDIEMPGMTGCEAAKEIKTKFPNLKLIMLSMHKEPRLIKQLIEIGVDGYLLKTSDQDELLTGINAVLKGQKYFTSEVTLALFNDEKGSGHKDNKSKLDELSNREKEILIHVCDGLSNKEIGEKLFISHRTVDTHRTNLMRKLEVRSVVELIKLAIKNGLIED